MASSLLENAVERQIRSLRSTEFQDFVVKVLGFRYGDDCVSLRQTGDEGADCILASSRTVVACYGPEAKPYSQLRPAFEKKMAEDFASYRANWESRYPSWQVVVNHQPAPSQVQFVDDLKPGSKLLGLTHLVRVVASELSSVQRRELCRDLRIPDHLLTVDFLDGLLEDILRASESTMTIAYQAAPMYVPEKIRLNFDAADVDCVQGEYDLLQESYFGAIRLAFHSRSDGDLTRIKNRIVQDFNDHTGAPFHERLRRVSQQYIARYAGELDDEYRAMIRAVLFWVFEQCLVGEKVDGERVIDR